MKPQARFIVPLLAVAILSATAIIMPFSRAKADHRVTFEQTDIPGKWFNNTAGPLAGSNALAVSTPGVEVRFKGESHTVHTRTSLIFPTGAAGMPFDTRATKGSQR
jgi:hypothetical protein